MRNYKKELFSKLFFTFLFLLLFSFLPPKSYAIVDPLSFPNNKIGVHILFSSEIDEAARLVNSGDGEWGYVTIPIQAGDRNLEKWQKFMDDAKRLKVIPIIRLATEGDFFEKTSWRKPTHEDILDFANFLNSLHWPTKNRYVIVFNETNRGDEWGGEVNAAEYAEILNYSVEEFKSRSDDFFIISAGLDNAAENNGGKFKNQYTYLQEVYEAIPEIFTKIDGIASHSYPNPGFKQPPSVNTRRSIFSFLYEKQLIDIFSDKDFPVFITETGWSSLEVSDSQMYAYFKSALDNAWNNEYIVAITPFLLRGGEGNFLEFSFVNGTGEETLRYKAIKEHKKVKGNPLLTDGKFIKNTDYSPILPVRDFTSYAEQQSELEIQEKVVSASRFVNWLLKI